jgi:hypothetical protein
MIDVAEVGDLGGLRTGCGRVRSIQDTGVSDPGYSCRHPFRTVSLACSAHFRGPSACSLLAFSIHSRDRQRVFRQH